MDSHRCGEDRKWTNVLAQRFSYIYIGIGSCVCNWACWDSMSQMFTRWVDSSYSERSEDFVWPGDSGDCRRLWLTITVGLTRRTMVGHEIVVDWGHFDLFSITPVCCLAAIFLKTRDVCFRWCENLCLWGHRTPTSPQYRPEQRPGWHPDRPRAGAQLKVARLTGTEISLTGCRGPEVRHECKWIQGLRWY